MKDTAYILSCEHAGNKISSPWDSYVKIPKNILNSHEGIDLGTVKLAKALEEKLKFPLYINEETRLLVELNRSLHHPKLFSRFSNHLSASQKNEILNSIYLPYRELVENEIKALLKNHSLIIHLSVHSFTPILNGIPRQADIGLLYDPSRSEEVDFCKAWQEKLKTEFRTRLNYPYRGTSDGFTKYLRTKFSGNSYCGIELEINQKLFEYDSKRVTRALIKSLEKIKNERY